MFKKILIANRGEIAVRVIRTCRDLGIPTLALYEAPDHASLHVRLADEAVEFKSPKGFMDGALILQIAKERGADALHPGIGFLAESPDFVEDCRQADLVFIGSTEAIGQKLHLVSLVRKAGYDVVEGSEESCGVTDLEVLRNYADQMGYPLVVKSCHGGRGAGERLIRSPIELDKAIRFAQAESLRVYGDPRVFLEKAMIPAHQVGVQVIADQHGQVVHLGDREGSLIIGNRKVVEESPAPCLTQEQREKMWQAAVEIAKLLKLNNVATVEFLVDGSGKFYFTEVKPRLQIDHVLTEMRSRVDLVREQILAAAGEKLALQQKDLQLQGWSMMCRINAEDTSNNFMPSPGRVTRARLPAGNEVRVDTYVYSGAVIPTEYSRLFALLGVWGADREQARRRLERAIEDMVLIGPKTNLAFIQRIINTPSFVQGQYSGDLIYHLETAPTAAEPYFRDLAVIAGVLYTRRNQMFRPKAPELLKSGWHTDSRRLPR
jgi:acetyl/propionyl-CoA carboxylase alpha subunit